MSDDGKFEASVLLAVLVVIILGCGALNSCLGQDLEHRQGTVHDVRPVGGESTKWLMIIRTDSAYYQAMFDTLPELYECAEEGNHVIFVQHKGLIGNVEKNVRVLCSQTRSEQLFIE